MTGIQNEKKKNLFVMQTSGFHNCKGKLSDLVFLTSTCIGFQCWQPWCARQIYRWFSTSVHVVWSMFWVTVATGLLIRSFNSWRVFFFCFRLDLPLSFILVCTQIFTTHKFFSPRSESLRLLVICVWRHPPPTYLRNGFLSQILCQFLKT